MKFKPGSLLYKGDTPTDVALPGTAAYATAAFLAWGLVNAAGEIEVVLPKADKSVIIVDVRCLLTHEMTPDGWDISPSPRFRELVSSTVNLFVWVPITVPCLDGTLAVLNALLPDVEICSCHCEGGNVLMPSEEEDFLYSTLSSSVTRASILEVHTDNIALKESIC